ncbi:hypothetical protein SNE40_019249 [Patella caerulea]|uniref:CCHC-type domain-containing protein n=1 Tax=Patella caerulea TaxID=87958 RepID=A0AAN8J8W7_PATCE
MIALDDGAIQMMVTAPGRLPLCLRCKEIGHVSTNCSVGDSRRINVEKAPSFADVASSRAAQVETTIADCENDTNSDSDDSMTESECSKGAERAVKRQEGFDCEDRLGGETNKELITTVDDTEVESIVGW